MRHFQTLLQELDQLYNSDTLEAYEIKWESAAAQIERDFPGFTLAYAELYNTGIDILPDGAMRHVIVPVNIVQ